MADPEMESENCGFAVWRRMTVQQGQDLLANNLGLQLPCDNLFLLLYHKQEAAKG